MNLKSLKDLPRIFFSWYHRGHRDRCPHSSGGKAIQASAMSVNYCMPRLSWHLATRFKGLHEPEHWIANMLCNLQYCNILISKVCFTAVYLLLNSNYHRKNIIPIRLTTDKMFYSKTWVQNTALPWITDLVCKCTFEYSVVRLVGIKIKYLFPIKFTIIGSNNKLLMHK